MAAAHRSTGQNATGAAALLVAIGSLLFAIVTGRWVLTAIPVGLLFGFFLQKGDLCGASAMSEVIAFRDGRKLFGLWVAIVVSMVAFAAGDVLDLVTLNPKPMLWLVYVVGGTVFGVGTVLAGGCVSGCLYKGATGNINSIAALLAMPAGIALVEYGPLNSLFVRMKSAAIVRPDRKALDLPLLTGVPYWALALAFAIATLGFVLWRRRRAPASPRPADGGASGRRWIERPWKPWQAGLAIGLLALPAYMSSAASGRNYPLGVSHGVLQAQELITESAVSHVYQKPVAAPPAATPPSSAPAPAAPAKKPVVWWLVLVVLGLAGGAFTAGRLSGQARLLPRPPEQTLVAIVGGFLVGAGAAIGTGCVVGNIMSGWALMSVGMFLFGAATLAGNWITTYPYLMGSGIGRR